MTKKSKPSVASHTPGPWDVGYQDNQCVHADGLRICSVECSRKEWKANARLIAAAPELLEALQAVLKTMYANPNENIDMITRCFTTVKQAIAKAEGK